MNITLLAAFMSTFTLIDADIDVTRRGISTHVETNPIAAIFTARGDYSGLYTAAYVANTAAFIGIGALGYMAKGPILAYAWQVLYIITVSAIEIYALSAWRECGESFHVRVNPLFILW